jgi:hypothetical protein
MTDETTTEAPAENINIGMEQICAAILATVGATKVPLEALLTNYSDKSIAVNQDPDTKEITFSLADAPAPAEESETEAE